MSTALIVLPPAQSSRPVVGLRDGHVCAALVSGARMDAPDLLPAGSVVQFKDVVFETAVVRGLRS